MPEFILDNGSGNRYLDESFSGYGKTAEMTPPHQSGNNSEVNESETEIDIRIKLDDKEDDLCMIYYVWYMNFWINIEYILYT